MNVTIAITAVIAALTATPAPAGGEPSYSYPPPTPPYSAPPVIVAAPPLNPLASIVLGAIGLPFIVLGGVATAVAPPVVVSCIAPDGSLFPCAGPTPGPGYGPQEPYPPASATYADPPTASPASRQSTASTFATMVEDDLSAATAPNVLTNSG
jgi:hypothetical protein